MDKVSIIIGLYNVASFLKEKRLSCILNQTYSNIEIILVNDGSIDETQVICEELHAVDNRIIIVNKPNGGLGSARNAGLDAATGNYIWFYDVDDEAELDLIEKNVRWMQTYQTDLNIFGYYCITPHLHTTEEVRFKERKIIDNLSLKSIFIDELLFVPNGNGFAWNKFYRKSFIDKHQIRFGNQRIQQDEVFNLQFYPLLEKVYISSELLYHYYIYNIGNTRSKFIKDRYEIYHSIFNKLKDFAVRWNLQDKRLEKYTYQRFYAGIENVILFNTFHQDSGYSLQEQKKEILRILNLASTKECLMYMKQNQHFGLEQRMYLKAYTNQSFYQILCLKKISKLLRDMKHFIKA